MAHITIAVTGSISAYKSADLVSRLTKMGHQITVLMTKAATSFITPLTFQVLSKNDVHLDIMAEPYADKVNHIEIGKETDLFIVIPATANTLARLANGFADNMVTSTALALPNHVKKIIAPAMNTKMYDHPATQTNLNKLESYGYHIIAPREAILACGDNGRGALADLDTIINVIKEKLNEETI
ncbi:Phosphopantothenoylcysteine decarboxylase / Phosphopantothenoylcysteine synthetase [Streptococcus sp. DD10]|uniref:phosphopantothenoylcysteine decarboxylase n=1 Tax=Streptococcus sp. DD10 TaxID=1777878 RepID=UPI000796B23B|nr:phosphopantothenoylcysteine decarboxylase [Streptococcus sp. DD10]KXT75133.1 Phosphopantothenoylcysteine decarboxylase / Phosphopantothenoylcysteine synthetase [Streptococcus sp. DD10]